MQKASDLVGFDTLCLNIQWFGGKSSLSVSQLNIFDQTGVYVWSCGSCSEVSKAIGAGVTLSWQTISRDKKNIMYSNVRALDINNPTSLSGSVCRHYQQTWNLHVHTPLFDAVPPNTLSRALPLHHSDAVQNHFSNGVAALWTEIVCRCMFVCVHICLSPLHESLSLCVLLSKWLYSYLSYCFLSVCLGTHHPQRTIRSVSCQASQIPGTD